MSFLGVFCGVFWQSLRFYGIVICDICVIYHFFDLILIMWLKLLIHLDQNWKRKTGLVQRICVFLQATLPITKYLFYIKVVYISIYSFFI